MMTACHACRGVKEILGMGMVYRSCHVCDGSGKIYKEPEIEQEKVSPKVVMPEPELPVEDKIEYESEPKPKKEGFFNGKKKKG